MCECNRVHNCRSRSFQGQPRSFGTNRKRAFDFLLVINSNLCRISHRFEIRRLIGRKSPIRNHPTLIQRLRSWWPPSNFGMNVTLSETRMMGLPYGEEIMIVGGSMWTQSTSVSDGRTDRITITKTVQRTASHGNDVMYSWYKFRQCYQTRIIAWLNQSCC